MAYAYATIAGPTLHPSLQTIDPYEFKYLYRAEFERYCCSYCGLTQTHLYTDSSRAYFFVGENFYEGNTAFRCGPPCFGCWNCCTCFSFYRDNVSKYYYDQGIYNTQDCCHKSGCVHGPAEVFPGQRTYVCCTVSLSGFINECVDHNFPSYCGEQVRYMPCQSCCCGFCPNRATGCLNCFGVCGCQTGQPCILVPFLSSLKIGTSQIVAAKLQEARFNWQQKTGQP